MADTTPIHPLRQRLIDDMTLRGFIPATQRQYIRIVRNCAAHAGKRPGDICADDARDFLLHLQGCGASVSTINAAAVALRFFLRVTLGRAQDNERIPFLPEAKRIPSVLTPDEVARILAATPSLKWRAALSLAYGAGLRAAEVCNLKVADIDGAQMRIRVVMGIVLADLGAHQRHRQARFWGLATERYARSRLRLEAAMLEYDPRDPHQRMLALVASCWVVGAIALLASALRLEDR